MILTAHSGSDGTPDNSLEFVERMIDHHVEFIEVDVRRAPDGKLYLSHDPINQAQDTSHLFKLEALFRYMFIRTVPMTVNCDLKEPGLEAEVRAIAEKWDLFDQVIYSGTVDPLKFSVWDRERIFYNIENCLPNIYNVKQLKKAHFDVVHYFCRKYNIHTLNLYYGMCTKEWIDLCHANDIRLSVWTVNNLEMIDAYRELGIDNVTTRRAIEYYKAKGEENQIGSFTKRTK